MSFASKEVLAKQLVQVFSQEFYIPAEEINAAVDAGWRELAIRSDDRAVIVIIGIGKFISLIGNTGIENEICLILCFVTALFPGRRPYVEP